MTKILGRRSLLATAICGLMSAGAVANDLALEEVLVTAEKRESSLQDTPISLLAFSNERLDRFGITDLADVAGLAPNVTITPFPNSRSSLVIFMRGVGNNDSQTTQDAAVGIYIDGVYVARSIGLGSDVADLERIEVLRGPQGTLYGRNTTGGAINLITAKPADEFGVSQKVSVGNRDYWQSLTKIESGKVGQFAGKFTYMESAHDGWVKNTGSGDNFGAEDKKAGRVAVRWDASESVTVDYAYDFSEIEGPQQYYQPTESFVPGLYPNASDQRSETGSWSGGVKPSNTDISGHSLTVTWDTAVGTVKSITGYRELEESIEQNYGGGAPGFAVSVDIDQDQFSQEFQLVGDAGANIRYVAGLYYFEEDGLEEEFDTAPVPPTFAIFPVEDRTIKSDAKAYAAYGQITWSPEALEQRLDVTLGGRYTVDKRSATKDSSVYFVGGEQSDSDEWSNFNPSLTLDYAWSDDLSTYAKVVTAYKAGGYNVRSTEAGFQPPFDEENMTSFELGMKSSWLNNRITANASVFHAEYEDMQLQQVTNNATIFLTDVYNVGEAEIDGLELDVMAVLVPGLTMQLSYGYTDADFVEYIDQRNGAPTQGQNIADQAEMPYAPEHNYTIGLEYQRAVGTGANTSMLTASLDYSWTDERYGTAFNDDIEGYFLDDYGVVNGRVALSGMTIGSTELEVAFWGRNLDDEEYKVHSISLGAYQSAYFGEPKSYGVDVKLSF
ncbi:TonB-dependent receptor [Spongiibacter sp. UBA1325]|uniref:TonB-dependent receptor n=1 Tax=Spongiibacter sp. UBA1325 TaxID=1947543 RepID=UPI0025801749|nr:TonB-dependent receptor [Spongiibacter sp. UBA1325]|tara:strand:+ start:363 stop:2534 length:2172 start_codon:yes stop_codon:yes gene_type:complete